MVLKNLYMAHTKQLIKIDKFNLNKFLVCRIFNESKINALLYSLNIFVAIK